MTLSWQVDQKQEDQKLSFWSYHKIVGIFFQHLWKQRKIPSHYSLDLEVASQSCHLALATSP